MEEGKHFDKQSPYRFRISSSGFVRNGKVFGGSVACPRMVLLRDHGIEETPEIGSDEWYRREITFDIGHANEGVYAKFLTAKGIPFKQEWFVCGHVDDDKLVEIAGSVDFITDGVPEELKAVSSTKQFKKICIDRQPKIENLCQLANYMLELESPVGNLRYTNTVYHSTTNWKAKPGTYVFKVIINEKGEFVVDNKPVFTVEEIMEHRDLCADMLRKQRVWQGRPEGDGFFDACGLCEWSKACDAFDKKEINTTEAFLTRCRSLQGGSGGK